jgi:hypothetical protein
VLHVVNGEATAIPVEGDRIYWFDFMMEGPLGVPWEQRAEYLNQHFGVSPTGYLEGKDRALAQLGLFPEHDEVVLWFEGDLFCLMNLVYTLQWFSTRELNAVRLSAVCPADERLGPQSEPRLRELFAERVPIGRDALNLGQEVWEWLLGGPKPSDFTAWPILERIVHLRQRQQGGEFESTILGLLSSTPQKLGLVFRHFNTTEFGYALGMGDLQFAAYVAGMQHRILIDPLVSGPPYANCASWDLALASTL